MKRTWAAAVDPADANFPLEVDYTIDHSARIRSRLDEIARRLPAPSKRPITIDVTPARLTLLAAG